jgi:hypothetical protein
MKRIIVAGLLGGAVVYLWSALSQSVLPLQAAKFPGSGSAVTSYVRAFVLDVMAALIVAMLLTLAAHSLRGYGQRVIFVTGIATFAVLVTHLADWNWGMFPTSYVVPVAADILIGWTLAGMVMAWRIKPEGLGAR